jgi:hypothetical protein
MFTSYGNPIANIAPQPVSTVIQRRQNWRRIVCLLIRKQRVVIEEPPLQRTINDEASMIKNQAAIQIDVVRDFFCTINIDHWGPFIAIMRFGPLSAVCTQVADIVEISRYFPRDHWLFSSYGNWSTRVISSPISNTVRSTQSWRDLIYRLRRNESIDVHDADD